MGLEHLILRKLFSLCFTIINGRCLVILTQAYFLATFSSGPTYEWPTIWVSSFSFEFFSLSFFLSFEFSLSFDGFYLKLIFSFDYFSWVFFMWNEIYLQFTGNNLIYSLMILKPLNIFKCKFSNICRQLNFELELEFFSLEFFPDGQKISLF